MSAEGLMYMHCTAMYVAASPSTDHGRAIGGRLQWVIYMSVVNLLSQSLVVDDYMVDWTIGLLPVVIWHLATDHFVCTSIMWMQL